VQNLGFLHDDWGANPRRRGMRLAGRRIGRNKDMRLVRGSVDSDDQPV
jgi:hypothetical protein